MAQAHLTFTRRTAALTVVRTALFVGLMFIQASANASLITRTYDFSVEMEPSAPDSPVTGSVTITFDPTGGSLLNQTTGIILNDLNISLGSAISFDYDANNDFY